MEIGKKRGGVILRYASLQTVYRWRVELKRIQVVKFMRKEREGGGKGYGILSTMVKIVQKGKLSPNIERHLEESKRRRIEEMVEGRQH